MFGVPIDGATSVSCDNQPATKNATVPASALSRKYNSICYHKVRESVASGWISIAWIKSQDNLADLFTKILPGPRFIELRDQCLVMLILPESGN